VAILDPDKAVFAGRRIKEKGNVRRGIRPVDMIDHERLHRDLLRRRRTDPQNQKQQGSRH
jgi:hypothetical protein